MRRLEGKTAIVTGGASGIGAATARRLAQEGGKIVVADINGPGAARVAEEIVGTGGDAFACWFDLRDEASIQALVHSTMERYGALDVLHNNAADISRAQIEADGPVGTMDPTLWDSTFSANLKGVMLTIKHALPALIASGNASIINTSSGAALLGDLQISAYSATKAAMHALTRSVATQYGRQGVRCNAICPGQIMTPGVTREHVLAQVKRHLLTPRLGLPEDIAAMVALLASADGEYITGQVIVIDGGLTAHFPHVADTYDDVA
jgi:NAD(P)-dependent dehydrogenase (short-subunit alcohol dehydrogenase family)